MAVYLRHVTNELRRNITVGNAVRPILYIFIPNRININRVMAMKKKTTTYRANHNTDFMVKGNRLCIASVTVEYFN